jgi:hypothetical protein
MDKRYEEALERAKMILCNLPEGSSSARDIETIFPELAESEDEKTRMELIEFHKDAIHTLELQERKENEWEIEKHKEFIAYLEKQKEQQPVPALDRGDEIILKAICEELKDAPGWVERIEGWYSLAKDAQQPAEWSEEDKKKIIFLERLIEHNVPEGQYGWADGNKGGFVTKQEAISMLESIRPQPHWKPSEEQIKALDKAIPVCMGVVGRDEIAPLESLYDDLKKL